MKPAVWLVPLTIALGAAFGASSAPDGLERVAEALGFAGRALPAAAPLAPTRLGGLTASPWFTAAAGILGLLLVYALFRLAAAGIKHRTPR